MIVCSVHPKEKVSVSPDLQGSAWICQKRKLEHWVTFLLCGRQCGGDIINEQLAWYKRQTKLKQIRTWRKKYGTNFGLGFSSA